MLAQGSSPPQPTASPERRLDKWSSEVKRALCTRDVGPPDDSRSWQSSVDWKLYKLLYNGAQKYEGAELTMGPAPETGDSRRSDAIMSGSCFWGLDISLYLPILGSVRS